VTTSPARSVPSVIRNADFVRLWVAETISQFGTQVSLLAIPLVAVTLLDASPFEVAVLGTVEFLPFILFSLPAGAWVDRLRRRPILIAGDIGRAVVLATVPIAYALGVLTMAQLYVVGFVVGTLTVLFDVAYQSYLPSLVERDQLVDGNSKLEASRTIAQSAGPALGGGLIGLVTAPLAILADAASFVVSGLSSSRSGGTSPPPTGTPTSTAGGAEASARRSARGCGTCSATGTCAASRHRPRRPISSTTSPRPRSSCSRSASCRSAQARSA
jgi:MFS family permease